MHERTTQDSKGMEGSGGCSREAQHRPFLKDLKN